MGISFAKFYQKIVGNRELRCLILGLDASGKTTILYRMKLGEVVTTVPTIGFNVQTLNFKRSSFTVWDVGGGDRIRLLWRHYYQNTHGLIYVVDCSDIDRLHEAKKCFYDILRQQELKDVPVLIFANKSDLPIAKSVAEIVDAFELSKNMRGRCWFAQATCGITGEGLSQGFQWLSDITFKQMRQKPATI